jgi:hypothetical protein
MKHPIRNPLSQCRFIACNGSALPLWDPAHIEERAAHERIDRLQRQALNCHAMHLGALARALENEAIDLLKDIEADCEYVPRIGIYSGGAHG